MHPPTALAAHKTRFFFGLAHIVVPRSNPTIIFRHESCHQPSRNFKIQIKLAEILPFPPPPLLSFIMQLDLTSALQHPVFPALPTTGARTSLSSPKHLADQKSDTSYQPHWMGGWASSR